MLYSTSMNCINRFLPLAACVISVCFLFASCKKKEDDTSPRLTIHNTLDKKLNFEIYGGLADYRSHYNAKVKGHINAGGVLNIPYDSLPPAPISTLYIDWYSDDLEYSNWGINTMSFNNGNGDVPAFQLYSPTQTDYYIQRPCIARRTLLSGRYDEGVFKFVDCYKIPDSVHSLWPSLTAEEKRSELRFAFNPMHGVQYTYFDATGNPHIITGGLFHNASDNYFSFMSQQVGDIDNCPSPNIVSNRYSKDTIRLRDIYDRYQIYVRK